MRHSLSQTVAATFEAKNWISTRISGPVPGEDLIEILSRAILGEYLDGMTLEEVQELVLTVANQRNEAYNALKKKLEGE